MTGLNRVEAASRAAINGGTPSPRRVRAKETTRMLLAVTTPIDMMLPVKAGMLSVVPVRNNVQAMPASAAGKALTIINGSSQD